MPYTCRCAFCGATIRHEAAVVSAGYAFKGGYADTAQGQMMKMASGFQANANLPFELEYAEKRLAHYRGIVASGKLKKYLETGKADKADWFRVEEGSPLENYLKSKTNKTKGQAQTDTSRLTDWPYRWREFTKATRVKCPLCGKAQPWCEDMDGGGTGTIAFLLGFGGGCFIGLLPLIAGVQLPPELALLGIAPLGLGIAAWIVLYRILRRRYLKKLAALPWNADDLPRFDEGFLAQTKEQFDQYRKMGLMY